MKCVKLAKSSAPTDLKALPNLKPTPAQVAFEKFAKEAEGRRVLGRFFSAEGIQLDDLRNNVGERVATLGSDTVVYCDKDNGLFSAILAAYNNHWKLRTSPEDWWFCVIKRVALAIDTNAQKDAVRRMFVEHKGKESLSVKVPSLSIYDVDYNSFFQKVSEKISENIKVPKYVDLVTADFTTTTPAMKLVSQITIMSSLQQYFEYGMSTCCGIPKIEMLGTENDWMRLGEKLLDMEKIMKPVSHEIGLSREWWEHAKKVFKKLLKTFQGSPDKGWWDKIIRYEGARFSGQTNHYSGWLTEFIEGSKEVNPECFSSGLVTVPLKIQDPHGVEDTAALVAGMLGYTLHQDTVPSVQPFQGWSLLLPKDSPFCSKTPA